MLQRCLVADLCCQTYQRPRAYDCTLNLPKQCNLLATFTSLTKSAQVYLLPSAQTSLYVMVHWKQ